MKIEALKTHAIMPGESLDKILDAYIPQLPEKTIVAVTSKIISLCQGCIVAKSSVSSKRDLIKKEADAYLADDDNLYNVHLTIKHNILIPSAGIDESNGDDVYILYPEHIQQTARQIWEHLRKRKQVDDLGVIITDSHTTPLRRGVTGITLGWCGFKPLYSYIGKPDIFGRPLRVTQINNIDALGSAAVFAMGEGGEQMPLALINNAPRIQFLSRPPVVEEEQDIYIPMEEDIYMPLFKNAGWIKNCKS
jgi:putative folate metabolism gamma-glutamate ligase